MKVFLFVVGLIGFSISAYGQWECPSQLGGSLKPLGNSKLMWGTEITGAAGYLNNNSIYNTMGLLGIDYTSDNHTIYAEGGFKYWNRTDYNSEKNINYYNYRFGLRELYYQNKSSFGNLIIGLQSMHSEDNYLLNERVAGINYKKSINQLSLNFFGGSVTKDFSRNGTFCNVAYLYDILPYTNRTIIGSSLGQTNMAGFTLSYTPSSPSSDDGLGLNNENTSSSFFHMGTTGLAFYSEFGNWVTKPHIFSGFYSSIGLGNDCWFKPEVLYQEATDNRAVIYSAKLEKVFTWPNTHRTVIEASYHGFSAIDKGAGAVNLFSNIFAGNVLRFDSPNLPFCQIASKHTISSLKTHLKLQYSAQTSKNAANELDVEIGKKFFGKLLVNGIYGYIKSPLLSGNPNLFRVEVRLDL